MIQPTTNDVLQYLFPGSHFFTDYELTQADNGTVYISSWKRSEPQPTPEQIEAYKTDPEFLHWLSRKDVPTTVTPRQLRLALIDAGVMPSMIDQIISTIEDPVEQEKAKTEWEYATEYNRNHPLIAVIAEQANKSEEDVDNLFRNAILK